MKIERYVLFLPAVLIPLLLLRGGASDRFQFIDIAAESGVTVPNTFGGKAHPMQ